MDLMPFIDALFIQQHLTKCNRNIVLEKILDLSSAHHRCKSEMIYAQAPSLCDMFFPFLNFQRRLNVTSLRLVEKSPCIFNIIPATIN